MRNIMRKRLTKAQKAHNRAEYNRIRRIWERTDKSLDYKTFKKIVQGISKSTGESVKEAGEKFAHSRMYKSAEDVGKENILGSLKEDHREVYDELRRKVGFMGKGEHLVDNIEWDSDKQAYIVHGTQGKDYMIDISNSPKEANLIELI